MIRWPTARVYGQDSYLLETPSVHLAWTMTGGMLGPVAFFPDEGPPILPYAVAPWAEERLAAGTPAMLAALRGDWFCSSFGENAQEYQGVRLPPHGETANCKWEAIDGAQSEAGCWLRLGMDLPLQGGRCEATTTLLAGQSIIYQRHDFSGLTGPVNPGHHATLAFPDREGAGIVSFSRIQHARTLFVPLERAESGGYSCLEPDVEIADLRRVRCMDGSMTDLTRYPARRGFEDLVILCAQPDLEFAWSAVTFPQEGYVWFAIRDPRHLASTVLWFSNGGRHGAPWNGRHVNVMGIEDVTAYFHVGRGASCRENPLSRLGVRTCLEPDADGTLNISYIQGIARIPTGFDRLAEIERTRGRDGIRLIADSGAAVEVVCQLGFLRQGAMSALE